MVIISVTCDLTNAYLRQINDKTHVCDMRWYERLMIMLEMECSKDHQIKVFKPVKKTIPTGKKKKECRLGHA